MKNMQVSISSAGFVMAPRLLLLNIGDEFNDDEDQIDVRSVMFTDS
jgi:hypothetical protein